MKTPHSQIHPALPRSTLAPVPTQQSSDPSIHRSTQSEESSTQDFGLKTAAEPPAAALKEMNEKLDLM